MQPQCNDKARQRFDRIFIPPPTGTPPRPIHAVSRGIDTRRCIVGINEPRAPAIPHSEQRAQFTGLPLRERPTVQLTLQYQNELGTKLRLEVADKSEIRRTHYEPACPPASVPPLITTAQQHHAPPARTRAQLAGQGFAERDAFVRAVSAQPLERAKFRDAPDAQLSPAAKADRATRAAYRPPVAMDIISQRDRYYEDRTYDPTRYKGFTRNNMYGTEGMLGSQVNIITGLPKRY